MTSATLPAGWCHPCNVAHSHKKHTCGKGRPLMDPMKRPPKRPKPLPKPPPLKQSPPTAEATQPGATYPAATAEPRMASPTVAGAAELRVDEEPPLVLCDRCKQKRPVHLLMKSAWETHCIDAEGCAARLNPTGPRPKRGLGQFLSMHNDGETQLPPLRKVAQAR